MMREKKEQRFEMSGVQQSGAGLTSVITDRETGVQYLLAVSPNLGSGMTVLVDREGKPLLSEG